MLTSVTSLLIVFFAVTAVTICYADLPYPVGDVRNCFINCPPNSTSRCVEHLRMESLPGVGFDNLRNIEMSAVIQYNYSQCKTTNDGRFLIPNDVLTIPIQRSRLDSYATIFNHWDDYVSMTSASINLGATVYSAVSGKFGFEYQHVKEHQVNNNARTTRTQMRSNLYKVILEPDAQLNPKFKNRLLDIAANIQNNNTAYASYLSELLVRDYGTHVLRSIDVGALISQIDSVNSNYIENKNGHVYNVTAAAAASFKGKFAFSFDSSFQHGNNHLEEYTEKRYHSQVVSIGGPLVHPNMTMEEWEAGVYNALVPIDRSGDPLHFIISSVTLPELPSPTLRDLIEYVYRGIEMYYSVNTHYGCTDPTSNNFDYQANLNDGSCSAPPTNYTFGGVFQTCKMIKGDGDLCKKGLGTKNPLTGNYSCPEGYTAQELHSGVATHTKKEKHCKDVCHRSGFLGLSKKCKCLSVWVDVLVSAKYHGYWCAATDPSDLDTGSGALFGGVFTSKNINPVTRSMTCPFHFYPLHIGLDLKVCISTQLENAFKYSVPFGGFTSCKSGNPLANKKESDDDDDDDDKGKRHPKHCPPTYKKFLATVDEGCEINYCAQLESDREIKPPKIPPYHSRPGLKVNITQSMVIQGPYGDIWVRNEQGNWMSVNNNDITGEDVLNDYYGVVSAGTSSTAAEGAVSSNGSSTSSGTIAVIVIGSALGGALIMGLCTVLGTITVKQYKKRKQAAAGECVGKTRAYSSFDDRDRHLLTESEDKESSLIIESPKFDNSV